jgi:hypothetical protein
MSNRAGTPAQAEVQQTGRAPYLPASDARQARIFGVALAVLFAVALSLNAVSLSNKPIQRDADALQCDSPAAAQCPWPGSMLDRFDVADSRISNWPFGRRSGCSVVLRSSKDRELAGGPSCTSQGK